MKTLADLEPLTDAATGYAGWSQIQLHHLGHDIVVDDVAGTLADEHRRNFGASEFRAARVTNGGNR